MFVSKKMIKNLLTGFSSMLKKRSLILALLLAVLIIFIFFATQHKFSPAAIRYTPINPDIAPMLITAMKNANVDFYLSGHDHNQQLIVKDKEPVYIVDGAGGRQLSSQKASSKDLRFFREGFGFVGLSVSAAKLNIDFYDSGAEKVASHQIDRNCISQKASCVKEMNK